ncbi:hypothetical protein ACFST9_04160 [Hymenobacter monticola]|uniref:Translation initiation factor IF-2 n=1 Tax=Hymenobacter monticola TaxID=1705399 RepID=A0ABY4B3B8_9BACT|nr:hypothetical protein [Hymenobacter monticola]UOE32852.1 hypothetical protein MTP16_17160 [Hymenobacter monticola]
MINTQQIADLLNSAAKNELLIKDIKKAADKVGVALLELQTLLAPDYTPAPKVPYIRKAKREQMAAEAAAAGETVETASLPSDIVFGKPARRTKKEEQVAA